MDIAAVWEFSFMLSCLLIWNLGVVIIAFLVVLCSFTFAVGANDGNLEDRHLDVKSSRSINDRRFRM